MERNYFPTVLGKHEKDFQVTEHLISVTQLSGNQSLFKFHVVSTMKHKQ